jgi:predicted nucleic acid-binding protein
VGWVEDLKGKRVGLDTSPFIYYVEEKTGYVEMLDPFFEAVDRGQISIVTSTVTLLEVLVQPLKKGDTTLAQQYRDMLFNTKGLITFPVSPEIAEEAAQLRALHTIRTPDSIQMATAIKARAQFFLTNDAQLSSIKRLSVLVLEDLRTELGN